MSSKDSDSRRRRKDRDSELDSTARSKDKDRHKSSHKKKSHSKERLRDSTDRDRSHSTRSHTHSKKMSLVPELDRRPSIASGSTLSYPTFSKAHSRESLEPRDDGTKTGKSPYTPDPTDLGGHPKDSRLSPKPARAAAAPPSPPLTADEPDLRRRESGNSMRKSGGSQRSDKGSRKRSDSGRRSSSGRRSVGADSQRGSGPKMAASKLSLRQTVPQDDDSQDSDGSGPKPSTTRRHATSSETSAARSQRTVSGARSATDSDATSIAPDQARVRRDPIPDSSPSVDNSSPRTPTSTYTPLPAAVLGQKGTPMVQVFMNPGSRAPSADPWAGGMNAPPPPPPPPPPMVVPTDVPRVDYLLQNGGLPHTVPKTLVAAAEPPLRSSHHLHGSPGTRTAPMESVQHLFAPFQRLLEDYNYVMAKNGSIAVATGYRSVARRLLDRLEAVFARDISSEACRCAMCRLYTDQTQPTEEETGVSWGEILEYVSGRRELPPWPPFTIDAEAGGLGISGFNQAAPMQKLDVDVPEEYRDHYIKQSKKTKQAVQSWLSTQPEVSTSPPQEVDDETLTFAMLTHLETEKRPMFTALLRGLTTVPASRTPTPLNVPRSELLVKTAAALQRLYRLSKPPRDPECAIFLLNYPTLHSILATLAAVSSGEWEILISGRFDGFLWSGAEGPMPPPNFGGSTISRGATATPLSRTTTPFSSGGGPSRGPTPFSPMRNGTPGFARSASTAPSSCGAPVQMDEEVEIATLAEVEREIFLGMEALEDAFEALHCKAEGVRRALRERSAGLAMAAQARRGSMDGGVEVRLGTPASGIGGWGGAGWETETDDGLDERSELAPDDSASNISYNRRRRPERRKQRNTPAPVEEEDESDVTQEAQWRR